jgi:manganese transport protein
MFEQEPVKLLTYKRIMVPLDHSEMDHDAVSHAAAMALMHGAKIFLLHVEEGVTSQLYGSLASTSEVRSGQEYLDRIAESLRKQHIEVEAMIVHDSKPRRAIVETGRRLDPDLLIMGAHGHKGLKDLFFGTTINKVRHELDVPILIVRKDV